MFKSILKRMIYVYRARKFCKIIEQETDHPTNNRLSTNAPELQYCLALFMRQNSKYDRRIAGKVLAYTGGKGYTKIEKSNITLNKQIIFLSGDGLELLTKTGYINALSGSIAQMSPVLSIVISLFALAVAIIVAVVK